MSDNSKEANKESYDFITALSREEKGDLSKAVRELVYRGRVLLAVEKYKKREASLGKAAEIAGLLGRMVTLLADYGVESNFEKEDYLEDLQNLRRVWWAPLTVLLMTNGYTADAAIFENGSEAKKTRRWECGCPKRCCPRSQGDRARGAVGSIDHGSIETTSVVQECLPGLRGWPPTGALVERRFPQRSRIRVSSARSVSRSPLSRAASFSNRQRHHLFGRPDDAIVSTRLNPKVRSGFLSCRVWKGPGGHWVLEVTVQLL